jgi:YfiH family protein
MVPESKAFFTIPEWDALSFLVHGFGDKNWKLSDFDAHPRLRHFKPVFLRQIHSGSLHIVDDVPAERLAGDALLTDRQGLLLVIKTADCLPVLITSRERRAVAAVHCGWKSISQRLVQKVVRSLGERFGCDPAALWIALGPCIGKDCYEVGEDVKQKFLERGLNEDAFLPHPHRPGKYYLDLAEANRSQLVECGVAESNIFVVDRCTYCEENFLSYRRSRRTKGRMLSFIGIAHERADL